MVGSRQWFGVLKCLQWMQKGMDIYLPDLDGWRKCWRRVLFFVIFAARLGTFF